MYLFRLGVGVIPFCNYIIHPFSVNVNWRTAQSLCVFFVQFIRLICVYMCGIIRVQKEVIICLLDTKLMCWKP